MAANVSLKPPARFDFKLPYEWPKWKRRFQQYLTATGLDKENDAQNVSTLLYCLGEESDNVLTSQIPKVFTGLGTLGGDYTIKLKEDTPVPFNKLPFGISSAPQLFQRRMNSILEGLEGVLCLMDDVLVYGKDEAGHDAVAGSWI